MSALGALGFTPALAADAISVLHAGSFTTLLERRLGPDFTRRYHAQVQGEGRGSVANAKLIAQGLKSPDVFVSSDAGVIRDLAKSAPDLVTWYASFATTAIVVAYSPKSAYAADFRDAAAGKRRWYDVLRTPQLKLGRTDPAIDPLGYRTLIAGKLADDFYHVPGTSAAIFGPDRNEAQMLTDEAILVRLEQGELDAAFVYGIEAVSRNLPFIKLPAEIDLSTARFAAAYAKARVTIDGTERIGEPIEYAFTIPAKATNAAGAATFLTYMLSPEGRAILTAGGLTPHAPQFAGNLTTIPPTLREEKHATK